jgi:hypothetical protein
MTVGNFSALAQNFTLTEAYSVLIPLVLFILGMVIYSIFIFKFYRFLAKREIFELNLQKYSHNAIGWVKKVLSSIFYLIES